MSGELDHIRERLVQARNTRAADLSARVGSRAPDDAAASGTFLAGDRVFDTVSGLEGIVLATPPLSAGPSGIVAFKADDGRIFSRNAAQLYLRPTPPGG